MKTLIAALAVAVLSALAPVPAEGGKPADKADNLVCRELGRTGSRLAKRRICLTRQQWAEQRRIQRAELERLQVRNIRTGSGE